MQATEHLATNNHAVLGTIRSGAKHDAVRAASDGSRFEPSAVVVYPSHRLTKPEVTTRPARSSCVLIGLYLIFGLGDVRGPWPFMPRASIDCVVVTRPPRRTVSSWLARRSTRRTSSGLPSLLDELRNFANAAEN